MAEPDKRPITMQELFVSSLAQADAPAKVLIAKGLITQKEFMQKISEERATYQKILNPTPQSQKQPYKVGPSGIPQELSFYQAICNNSSGVLNGWSGSSACL